MAVQLVGIGLTMPSVGVSLTPTTLQMAWSGESLIGIGQSIPGSTVSSTGSSTGVVSPSMDFSVAANSQYVAVIFTGFP